MSGARGMPPAGAPVGALPPGAVMTVVPWPFAPSSTSTPLPVSRDPKRWPTTSAMSDTRASAATAHGSTPAKPRDAAADAAPAGVPQRWQKCAPVVSEAPQVEQAAPASAVPQLEQNRPFAAAPQEGQVGEEGVVTRES